MSAYFIIFFAILAGYIFGRIKFFGMQLGSSGVLIVALVLGHLGYSLPGFVRDFGLVNFVTAVGLLAGPVIFKDFKANALSFITLGALISLSGAAICALIIKAGFIPAGLAAGMMAGALTSTPGLATAAEAFSDPSVAVGYGIAYPFGVLGVVLFVQVMPKLYRYDAAKNVKILKNQENKPEPQIAAKDDNLELDAYGLAPFALAALLGVLIGSLNIPLPGGLGFSLGLSGGPLIAGLIVGHFGKAGGVSLKVPKATIDILREYGLLLFLMSAGIGAGAGFVGIIKQYGAQLFILGALMTLIPMILGFLHARYIAKLDFIVSLGAICGGMTSTPALGSLMSLTKDYPHTSPDDIAASYAATYPVALILIVILMKILSLVFT